MQHPRRTTRRTLQAGALVIASGTAVVAAATGAGAAPAAVPDAYGGTTASVALNLSLLKGAPGLSSLPIDTSNGLVSLQLLPAQASLVHSASTTSATSSVALYGGTLTAGMASPVATASLASPGPNKATGVFGLPDPLSLDPVASASVPDLTASSAKSPLSTSSAATGVGLDAVTLADLVPAADLTQFTTGCATLASQLTTLITALKTVDGALTAVPSTGAPDPFTTLISALQEVQTESTALCSDIADGAVLKVQGLVSSSSIRTVGSQEVSTAHVELGSISLLGGFASLTGFNNTVTAKAGGTAGSASFTPTVTDGGLGALTFAGNTAGIDGSGLETDFQGVDAALTAAGIKASDLDTLFTALQSGLSQLNSSGIVTLTADTPSKVAVAPDGTSATGELDGLDLAVNLPTALPTPTGASSTALTGLLNQLITGVSSTSSAGTTLTGLLSGLSSAERSAHATTAATSAPIQVLSLQVGSVGAAAEAQNLPTTVKGETFTKTPTATGPAPASKLAFTGADLPATGGIALLLVLAGGYALRRRRTGHDGL